RRAVSLPDVVQIVQIHNISRRGTSSVREVSIFSYSGCSHLRILMYLLQFPLLFFLFSLSSASFDDSLARSFMFPLSSAAYSNHPQRCLTNKIKGAQVSKQVMLNCDYFKHDKCSGYTFFDESRKVIGIAFRGTGDTVQLIVEITDTVFNAKVDFQDGGQTSKYFNDAFIDVWNGGLAEDFDNLLAKYPDYAVWVSRRQHRLLILSIVVPCDIVWIVKHHWSFPWRRSRISRCCSYCGKQFGTERENNSVHLRPTSYW
ncbi:hypothetical protein PFISCL1PPCAC_2657, partial [Pristionchus fissidentatus]